MQQRIYIDTSVIGGYHDEEFRSVTRLFFQRVENEDYQVNLSEISQLELINAPQRVKRVMDNIPNKCLVILEFTDEAQKLAENYIRDKILGTASLNDAYHIAIATVNR